MDKLQSALVFGEVLIDRFDTGPERRGGAPFNVAWHLRGFSEDPVFISRVGQDETGRTLLADMRHWDLAVNGIQIDETMPTGFVSVRNQETHPEFEIHADVAYDFINPNGIDKSILKKKYGIIYHGSLALRSPLSKSAFELILHHHKQTPVFFDVNLRPPWWDIETIRHYLDRTNFLKCNADELRLLLPDQMDPVKAARTLLHTYNFDSVIVTRGAKGAFLYHKNDECFHAMPDKTAKIINTVGAGDGFSAVMILGIMHRWPLDMILRRANSFAAAICSIEGAVPDSQDFYSHFINQWI